VLKSETKTFSAGTSFEKWPFLRRVDPSPNSSVSLRSELAAVRQAWTRYQETRARDGVYQYLGAVFALVEKWTRLGCAQSRGKRVLRLQNMRAGERVEPFAVLIACTANTDARTASKWSRALRYVAQVKKDREGLAQFMKGLGGINACAALFSGVVSPSRKRSR
jgi:hypothetical protein